MDQAEHQAHSELLTQFKSKLDEFEQYQKFIEKAEAQRGRFKPQVVEKVISSNSEKMMGVVESLVPPRPG